jgi:hypothetical protein
MLAMASEMPWIPECDAAKSVSLGLGKISKCLYFGLGS